MGMTEQNEGHQSLEAPQPLKPDHQRENFTSGSPELDNWLKTRALKNEDSGASRTYVVCVGDKVIAYYCLANGSILSTTAPGRVRRNMPDPIPVMVIGRLAVSLDWQGKGIGQALVRDAVLRTLQAATIAGIRGILVHALNEDAKAFYLRCGFMPSPLAPMTLMLTLADAKVALGIQ
ncbi:GNAT family N-acetyltransferase [Brasilonema octagenarum UFV-E1]|uniref:GNAT family N-acetyltransferase n=3 Tax=Scytonemataceae TaxID=1182 RepID=A0A856MHZ3_9CYAN|nr:GNAT family N-acetyltransferase [Brasilonema octagenarum UFV-OR1]QDL09864.1 GNAT family N-acetyltransferase [Brasilonema sennae CENA114]QDL16216.1 GNAT family N-acetyltransferase [Brasilonema octagenarum UFV-E1]